MAFKVFTNGAILADTDLNDYLMKQTVIVCTSGTRPSSPVEGMTIYETDTDRYASWNGSAWLTYAQTSTATFNPSLTAATTNPTLGTGGLAEGRYTLWGGKFCHFSGTVQFGTSGANAGSGQYFLSLPFSTSNQIANGVRHIGTIAARDSSPVALFTGVCYAASNAATMSFMINNALVNNAAPITWAANDYISFSITYEIN